MTIFNERKTLADVIIHDDDLRRKIDFIFDSGSSKHMCPDIDYFDEIVNEDGKVILGNGESVPIKGIGRIGILEKVLYVPDLTLGLVSVGQLDSSGHEVSFSKGKVKVKSNSGKEIMNGYLEDDLYHLDNAEVPSNINIVKLFSLDVKEGSAPDRWKNQRRGGNLLEQLHTRWGHVGEKAIREAIKRESVIGSGVTYSDIKDLSMKLCPDCMKGKMEYFPAKLSTTDYSSYSNFQLMATDDKGPFQVESISDKYKYLDLFAFKSSRWLEVRFKRSKDGFYENLEDIISTVALHDDKIKEMQSDHFTLYESKKTKDILAREAINQRMVSGFSHSSNGWIEREVKTVMNMARTIMMQHNTPLRFWAHAVQTAVYLINRTPKESLDWRTPFEAVYQKKPDISNFVPFYSPGMLALSSEQRKHPFDKKAIECRFVGYDEAGKNQYFVWIPSEKRMTSAMSVSTRVSILFGREMNQTILIWRDIVI
jgi:hypothetical protein